MLEKIAAILDPAAFDVRRAAFYGVAYPKLEDKGRVKRRRIATAKAEKIMALFKQPAGEEIVGMLNHLMNQRTQQEIEKFRQIYAGKGEGIAVDICNQLLATMQENARLRNALEFYASPMIYSNWMQTKPVPSVIEQDRGFQAQQALRNEV